MDMRGMSMVSASTAMDMPSSTMEMPMSTSTAMGSMSTSMSMSQMAMVFFNSSSTPLFTSSWVPASTGQYAGACIFLIVLAFALRLLYFARAVFERRWRQRALNRRPVRTMSRTRSDADIFSKAEGGISSTVTLTTDGVDGKVRLVEDDNMFTTTELGKPWRLSEDLPRALLLTLVGGVNYLLMLAVMTMNVGYFLSVLAGIFIGELFLGRYLSGSDSH